MTHKKAQGMGLFIVLIISSLAILGVVGGTINVWNSLACTMGGAQLRTSFAPHVGNIKVTPVDIELVEIREYSYDSCFSDYVSNDRDACINRAQSTPDPQTFCDEEAINNCKNKCHPEQKCKEFFVNGTYYGRPNEVGTVELNLLSKNQHLSEEIGSYLPMAAFISTELTPQTTFQHALVSAYVPKNTIVGFAGSYNFYCEGSRNQITAKADGKTAKIEEDEVYNFCLMPVLRIDYERIPAPDFNIVFNITSNSSQLLECWYNKVDNIGDHPATYAANSSINEGVQQITHTPDESGIFYFLCESSGAYTETWEEII